MDFNMLNNGYKTVYILVYNTSIQEVFLTSDHMSDDFHQITRHFEKKNARHFS